MKIPLDSYSNSKELQLVVNKLDNKIAIQVFSF